MKLAMIGLGKMGLNLSLNLKDHEVDVVGFDVSEEARMNANRKGMQTEDSLEKLLRVFDKQKVVMLSTPAGEITNTLVKELCEKLNPGDILIDSGNSYFKDSLENYERAKKKEIGFLDCGTSGGMDGARNGACLMIGGDKEIFQQVEGVFEKLGCEKGYLYTGRAGSGHYLKMVHNGIEYGMMQAIGEGFDILQASDFEFDFEEVASIWNHGSVIRSWLMELAEESFVKDPKLDNIKGVVDASGEGKWTIEEALRLNIPVPAIASALFARNTTKIDDSFSAKVVATMRHGFGGHDVSEK
ncbi:decarboxylating 6-phosphogluconate dehydrogenase [Jeotgalibaca sp. MA1X17-3]|uniref:phosphogluconate dehydrogenase (NAD(+)-dependent, decarboxylating) n=1 Tax=Jeotgalibaca sp. MA1X17-3 TaxID=2908211 RepID=UPI001F359AA6|nr:decarboxylating 6-phosphogluconate dehydrogenase [Jeotgalibaca sp. MA1X17-3]UJF16322.1 decarboxylating 6-phosphogluconate dehydrogenase [Jeotgalibaca sp. MA1X17-3]